MRNERTYYNCPGSDDYRQHASESDAEAKARLRGVTIRLEQPDEQRAVEELTREAFWNVYKPGCVEHYVLHRYRSHPDFIPQLNFVMLLGDQLIGHVMFSKAQIVRTDGTALQAWTFGPISIAPDYKRQGYGLLLLQYAMEKARAMGIGVLCMEGNIDFYRHAGFVLASSLHIHYHGEPAESDVPYFLAQELIPGYLNGVEGTYHTPPCYFIADEDEADFQAFEATFAPKEKALRKGQLPQFCQSCGMPLTADDVCGTNADGTICYDYCRFCYQQGQFAQPFTMDQMIDHCAQFVGSYNESTGQRLTADEYKDMMRRFFPTLKRWRRQEKEK